MLNIDIILIFSLEIKLHIELIMLRAVICG